MDVQVSQWIGKRQKQEDAYAVKHFPTGTLAIICDGMGGHHNGAAAAHAAVTGFQSYFKLEPDHSIAESLKSALNFANEQVGSLFSGLDEDESGGCTLIACYATQSCIWWVSVGDSPLFIWRKGRLIRLNDDHSLRSIYEDLSLPPSLRSQTAPNQRNMLRSALMGDEISLVDAPCAPYPLLPGDRVIISSDGTEDLLFHTYLPLSVQTMLNSRSMPLATQIITACEALDEPYADNATVLTMDV